MGISKSKFDNVKCFLSLYIIWLNGGGRTVWWVVGCGCMLRTKLGTTDPNDSPKFEPSTPLMSKKSPPSDKTDGSSRPLCWWWFLNYLDFSLICKNRIAACSTITIVLCITNTSLSDFDYIMKSSHTLDFFNFKAVLDHRVGVGWNVQQSPIIVTSIFQKNVQKM